MRDYMRELRDMKARVSERPYLFEQAKQVGHIKLKLYCKMQVMCLFCNFEFLCQKNAKAHAEQTYRRKLQKAGIKEQFVEKTSESFRFDNASTDTSSHGSEKEVQSR